MLNKGSSKIQIHHLFQSFSIYSRKAIMNLIKMCVTFAQHLLVIFRNANFTYTLTHSVSEYSNMLNSSKCNYLAIWHIKRFTTSTLEGWLTIFLRDSVKSMGFPLFYICTYLWHQMPTFAPLKWSFGRSM